MKYLYILSLIISLFWFTSTSAIDIEEKSDFLKGRIKSEIKKGVVYTKTIEIYVLGISKNEKKLNTLLSRVISLEKKLQTKVGRTSKENQVLMLVTYIKYQLFLQLTPLQLAEYEEVIELAEEIEEETPEPVNEQKNITSPIESEIEFLKISPEQFNDSYGNKSPSQIEKTLKEIYQEYRGMDPREVDALINEAEGWFHIGAEQGRDTQRKTDIEAIQKTVETYKNTHGSYPTYEKLVSSLSESMPRDPLGGFKKRNCRHGYFYEQWANGNDYRISTCIESPGDTSKNTDGGMDPNRYEVGTDVSYAGKGVSYINNSDIFYFSLVDQASHGGSIHNYHVWANIPEFGTSPSKYDVVLGLLKIEYEKQNPWIDTNIVSYNIINVIASALDSYFLNGDILELIEHNKLYQGDNISVGGPLEGGSNYKVGRINYNKLGLASNFPKDSTGQDFILAYANTGWGHYQILGRSFEKIGSGSQEKAMIRGTYNPKKQTLTQGVDYKLVSSDQIQITGPGLIYIFRTGEFVNNSYEIIAIDYDTNILTISPGSQSLKKIYFDEPDGLIFDPKTHKPYTDQQIIK